MRGEIPKEKVQFNLAILKRQGMNFEIAVDPDLAIKYKTTKQGNLREILRSEHIFKDTKKGEIASENEIKEIFQTDDSLKVAETILNEGEIQLSGEYREKVRQQKKAQLIELIKRNAIDPKTKLPIPETRLNNAFEEAKIRLDERKSADQQLEEVIKQLRTILPLSMETKKLGIKVPAVHAAKSYSIIKSFGKTENETWQTDGSLLLQIEIPAGLQNDFFDKLNSLTHGEVEIKIIGE